MAGTAILDFLGGAMGPPTQTPRSMYPSIFNTFPVIRTAVQKIAVFTYHSPHFCFPWRRPGDYHAVCCMDGKTIQCLPNPSRHTGGAYSLQKFRHDRISSFQVIRVWNFRRSGLKVLFTPPKFEFLGSFTPKFRGTSFRPPKGTSLRDFTSNELSRVKMHQPVWPVHESQKKGINK